ncbi:Alpha- and gamma-adaptin-binding protein p34 [Phytophthora cinnamomi]|uniref:Alpha- and gamma-adaptin-binding protein p34 n=1 Tax=Phytophthora cinnamomi TaxID=4785 RepID=UPI003559D580|nr:Alpha- and gamma-adaptin-binding protein p34 [Phytophthora cinnamomi]
MDAFPVLTSARVACRECLALRGLGELPHVVFRVDAFLDVCSGPEAVVNACERGGSLRLLTYLAARDTKSFWGKAAVYAAMHGYVYILQWLSDFHAERCEWGVDVLDSAAGLGHFSAVQWLHMHRSDGCTACAMDHAAGRGFLPMVKWLHANRCEGCTTRAMNAAALNGDLRMVQWLHENRREGCTTDAMDFAAEMGHLEVVKWLHENRSEGCTASAMTYAAEQGHLEVVQWLQENRTEGCTEHAFGLAAGKGHLEVVQWLDANQHKGTLGHALRTATTNGHIAVINWLLASIDNGREHEIFTCLALKLAKKSNQWRVIRWLEPQVEPDPSKRQRLL